MSATTTALLTVDEFREFADANPWQHYELHDGQIVKMTQPKFNHQRILKTLFKLLDARIGSYGEVFPELGYRGTPEYDARRADIGVISAKRLLEATQANEFFGAPDLVVEILSPSNRSGDMRDKQKFCLDHGCQSFWVVNPVLRTVRITGLSNHTTTYEETDSIPLAPFASASIPVAEIFEF